MDGKTHDSSYMIIAHACTSPGVVSVAPGDGVQRGPHPPQLPPPRLGLPEHGAALALRGSGLSLDGRQLGLQLRLGDSSSILTWIWMCNVLFSKPSLTGGSVTANILSF